MDPAIFPFIARSEKLCVNEVDEMLNKKSGLLGICGMNDMRDIHAARAKGDERARLAFEMFAYRVKSFIGSYLAVLGRADAVVFTAGIGENDPEVRALACQGLEGLGIRVSDERNGKRCAKARSISADDSPVQVLVIPTNEELEIARATKALVAG